VLLTDQPDALVFTLFPRGYLVIFIWGWRAVSLLLGTGVFHCPHCQADSEYKHLRSRRWFTVLFLPVIPLNKLGEHVLCQRCGSTFRMAVLDYPTLGQECPPTSDSYLEVGGGVDCLEPIK